MRAVTASRGNRDMIAAADAGQCRGRAPGRNVVPRRRRDGRERCLSTRSCSAIMRVNGLGDECGRRTLPEMPGYMQRSRGFTTPSTVPETSGAPQREAQARGCPS